LAEEKEVGEPREAYVTEVPLYYDRFIEERDRRIAAELHELRSLVEVNTQRIEELRVDLLGGLAVAKEDRLRGFGEARQQRQRGFEEARGERLRGFEEARQECLRIESKADAHFRWTIGLLMPIVVGVLVIIVRSLLGLP